MSSGLFFGALKSSGTAVCKYLHWLGKKREEHVHIGGLEADLLSYCRVASEFLIMFKFFRSIGYSEFFEGRNWVNNKVWGDCFCIHLKY